MCEASDVTRFAWANNCHDLGHFLWAFARRFPCFVWVIARFANWPYRYQSWAHAVYLQSWFPTLFCASANRFACFVCVSQVYRSRSNRVFADLWSLTLIIVSSPSSIRRILSSSCVNYSVCGVQVDPFLFVMADYCLRSKSRSLSMNWIHKERPGLVYRPQRENLHQKDGCTNGNGSTDHCWQKCSGNQERQTMSQSRTLQHTAIHMDNGNTNSHIS